MIIDIFIISWYILVQSVLLIQCLLMIHLTCFCSFPYTDNYLINHKKDNLYPVREKWWTSIVVLFTMVYGCCAAKILRFYLRAPRCSGRGSSYTPTIVINPSWVPSGTCLAKCQVIGSLFRTCTESIINIIRWSHHQFLITNLDLLIYGCMCVEMYTRTHT